MTADLTTTFMGMRLSNPVVAAACPLTEDLGMLAQLEAAGVAAAVFPSLFEEQIDAELYEVERMHEMGAESQPEASGYFPELDAYNFGPDRYLDRLRAAKCASSIPLIGSLNGATDGGWVRYASMIEQAGADALELNVTFVPTDASASASDVEERVLRLVSSVRSSVGVPLTVKVPPYFSAFAHLAGRLRDAGADGLTLFNRMLHAEIDLDDLKLVPRLELSTRYEARLAMMWIAILRDALPEVSMAATGGVHDARGVAQQVLAGADAVMMASALYRGGAAHAGSVVRELGAWLDEREYASIEQMKGSMSRGRAPEPEAYERVNYMRGITRFASARPG